MRLMRPGVFAGEVLPLANPLWYASQEIGWGDRAQHMMQIVLDGLCSWA